jgi:uncharacterized protein
MTKPEQILRVALVVALCAHTASAWSANPSFNCAKASSSVEKLICNDAELADLDRSLATLYGRVLENSSATDNRLLKAEQRGWIKGRDDCWKSDDMRGCVLREYRYRIDALRDR